MRYRFVLVGICLLSIASFSGFSFKVSGYLLPAEFFSSEYYQTGKPGSMKMQLSHLQTIDPLEVEVIPFGRPIPYGIRSTSDYGMRLHPLLRIDKLHKGVDFGAPVGTPVLATATGRVAATNYWAKTSPYGKWIVINHDEEFSTLYAHLSTILVDPEQIVELGDTIGLVGSTGRSSAPHLHYEVIRDGHNLDPADFF